MELTHLTSRITDHDAPGADIRPPPGCQVRASAYLIRHSSITANDDEWEDYMSPFVTRLQEHRQAGAPLPTDGPLAFLQDWQSPVRDDNLELLTKFGAQDATTQGRRIRKLHPHLFPPAKLGKKKAHDKAADAEDNVKVTFKIWAASSSRDEGTAKAWIRGAFPEWQRGENGEGDGKVSTACLGRFEDGECGTGHAATLHLKRSPSLSPGVSFVQVCIN